MKSESHLIGLQSTSGLSVLLSSFGARIIEIHVPDKNGHAQNVTLGERNKLFYEQHKDPYFGCIVGRVANRIKKGQFSLAGKSYQITQNENQNTLHGGRNGLSYVDWNLEASSKAEAIFTYFSPDGEEGFPGDIEFKLKYQLINSSLHISISASPSMATPINITQHPYFNLSTNKKDSILNHQIKLLANYYIAVDNELIPTGEIPEYTESPLRTTSFTKIGTLTEKVFKRLDHTFVLNKEDSSELNKACMLYSEDTGILLSVFTTQPGIHIYDGFYLDQTVNGAGVAYVKHAGLAIEPQHFPDSLNNSHFPPIIYSPNSPYNHTIIYSFDTII